jgi:hypothetical protein
VPTWRGALLGLALHYIGVAVLLSTVSDLVAGVVEIVTAIGIVAIFASDQRMSLRVESWLVNPFSGIDLERDDPLSVDFDRPRRRVRRRVFGPTGLPVRPFELSVIALAVLGAFGIVIGRPTFGAFGADAVIGVLVLTGVLYCLLGGLPRWTSGLLFLGSAVNVLLHEASSTVSPVETLLDAGAQIALALALIFVCDQEVEAADSSRPEIAPTPSEPVEQSATPAIENSAT